MIDWKERMIEVAYGGDTKRFEKDYKASVDQASKYAISWTDLELTASTLNHLEATSKELIEEYLGYLPHLCSTVRFEPFIRALVQSHSCGQISNEDFSRELEEQIKLIRNDDMDFHTSVDYEPDMYRNHAQQLTVYRNAVQERLVYFLGYQPELRHSVAAELWMQSILSKDTLTLPEILTPVDIKAIALIKYREVLLSLGKDAADKSPLWNRERIEKRI